MKTKKHNKQSWIILSVLLFLLFGCTAKKEDPDPIVQVIDPNTIMREPVGTVVTESGETVDLAALKEQYGDLYRFVEPMTEKEINDQFENLFLFLRQRQIVSDKLFDKGETRVINIFGNWIDIESESFKNQGYIYIEMRDDLYAAVYNSNDSKLDKYKSYFLKDSAGYYCSLQIDIEKIAGGKVSVESFDLGKREAFLRYYKFEMEITEQAYQKAGVPLVSAIKDLNTGKAS